MVFLASARCGAQDLVENYPFACPGEQGELTGCRAVENRCNGKDAIPRQLRGALDQPAARSRAILGLAPDEAMPRVGLHSLRQFHGHLVGHLTFPFAGTLMSPIGPHRDTVSPLSVVRLMDPVEEYAPEEMYGLICKVV